MNNSSDRQIPQAQITAPMQPTEPAHLRALPPAILGVVLMVVGGIGAGLYTAQRLSAVHKSDYLVAAKTSQQATDKLNALIDAINASQLATPANNTAALSKVTQASQAYKQTREELSGKRVFKDPEADAEYAAYKNKTQAYESTVADFVAHPLAVSLGQASSAQPQDSMQKSPVLELGALHAYLEQQSL